MKDDYEDLLDKARKDIPEDVFKKERLEVPKVRGHIQGNKTIISNFYQISDILHRKPEHILKFILKELATPGELKKAAAIIGSKVPASRINEKIQKYVNEFVTCKECGKLDTKLNQEGSVIILRCLACGAHRPVKSRI